MIDAEAPTLELAIRYLAGRCDGARTLDGTGFNAYDTDFGHSLADQQATWSPKQRWAAWKLSRKYRVQLASVGIAWEDLPVPPDPYGTVAATTLPPPPTGAPGLYQIRLVNGEFHILAPYNPALVTALRALPRRRWDGMNRRWIAPAVDENLEPLQHIAADYRFWRDEASAELIDATLDAQKAQRDAEAALEVASRAHDADLTVEGLGGTLRPFQRAGVAYADRTERTFIADEQGLGKTVQALATLELRSAYPAVIICPATLKPNWHREATKWLPRRSILTLGRAPDLFALHADVVILNYDALVKYRLFLRDWPWKAVVCDESHYLKTPSAIRTVEVAELMEATKPQIRLLLTGTPVVNSPDELLSQLRILDRLEDLGGIGEFRTRYINGMRLKELNDRLRRTCFIRRLKADVLTELPAKVNAMQTLTLSNRAEYDHAEHDLIEWVKERAEADEKFAATLVGLDDEQRAAAMKEHASDAAHRAEAAEALVRINALKYLAAQGKAKAAIAWIGDFLENGEKLVVFAEHVDLQEKLVAAFPGCAHVLGADRTDERQRQVDRFQNDPATRLIVCSMQVASLGITLTAASDVAILELGWTPAGIDQATDRCHRIGQTDSVTAWHLLAENSIDEWISDLIDQKRKTVTATTDGADTDVESLLSQLMAKLRLKAA